MHPCKLERGVGFEGKSARKQSVENDAERIDVAGGCRPQPLRLFGRDVGGRAEQRSGLGQRFRALQPGDAEVRDLRPVLFVEEHVRGFQVAVDEAAVMRVSEAGGKLAGDSRCLLVRPWLTGNEPVLERPAGEILEDHERPSGRHAIVIEAADIRM